MDAVIARVREQAVVFGSRKSLVGILTPAQGGDASRERPCVVILSAGIIHRVGPNRLHVELARTLSSEGYTCLRFDLSGIGDSEKRSDGLPPLEASLADIREAADWLQATRGVNRLILVGLCSGADQGLIYAGTDPRVVGLVLLDPSIPRTPGQRLRYIWRRILQPRHWLSFGGKVGRVLGKIAGGAPVSPPPSQAVSTGRPSVDSKAVREYLTKAYQRAVDRRISFLAVFAADRDFLYNYREQMLHALRGVSFGSLLQLEYFCQSDHTFAAEPERLRLVTLIRDWIQSRAFFEIPYPAAPTPRLVQEQLP
jgi:pimeloyl-ACP methyl ester carboxylesterase